MKNKPVSKAKREEWEKFLKQNQRLPIYMGDHMTRPWTRNEAPTAQVGDEDAKNNDAQGTNKRQTSLGRNNSQVDQQSKSLPLTRSQYSIRKISNGKRKLKSSKEILARHNITEDDVAAWHDSFDTLLNSPAGKYVFTIFLESEIADENLKFWLACEELKHTKAKKKIVKLTNEIYATYIDVYSPHEINIEYKMREEIVEKLRENADTSVFLQAQHQVYNLMHRDSYPRFLTSPFLAKIVSELSKRRESEVMKTVQEEVTSRTSSGLISCCCCRGGGDHDIAEDQRTTSTSVAYRASDVGTERDYPTSAGPRSQPKTNSSILHDLKTNEDEAVPNSIGTSPNDPEDIKTVTKSHSNQEIRDVHKK